MPCFNQVFIFFLTLKKYSFVLDFIREVQEDMCQWKVIAYILNIKGECYVCLSVIDCL